MTYLCKYRNQCEGECPEEHITDCHIFQLYRDSDLVARLEADNSGRLKASEAEIKALMARFDEVVTFQRRGRRDDKV